jgi:Nucleoside-diphosphate-sugar epimerases
MYKDSIKSVASSPDIPFEKLTGKNIMVTGATGLIGTSIIDVLMERSAGAFHVYAAGRNRKRAKERFSDYWGRESFHFVQYDVLEPLDSDVEFQFIIHAASDASPSSFVSRPVEVMKANINGLCNLFDYGMRHGLSRLLYVSSGEVYGQGDGTVFFESDSGYVNPTLSRSCYPSSKRAAETLCASYADEYNIDAVIARPCHVFGPLFTVKDNRAFAQFYGMQSTRKILY